MDKDHIIGLIVLAVFIGGLYIIAKVYGPDFEAEREHRKRHGVGNSILD